MTEIIITILAGIIYWSLYLIHKDLMKIIELLRKK